MRPADAFRLMKPNDAVIVGMYPEFEDQVALNVEYVRRHAGNAEAAVSGL